MAIWSAVFIVSNLKNLSENSSMASQSDILPGESISQIDYHDSLSRTDASRPVGSTSQSVFLSQFSTAQDLGPDYVRIENDPITLTRSKQILGVAALLFGH